MNLNLKLFVPLGPPLYPVGYVVVTFIYIEEDDTLLAEIKKIESYPCSPHAIRFGNLTYEDDNYGKPLRWIMAKNLRLINISGHPLNVAAKAYIDSLPPDWPIILFWY